MEPGPPAIRWAPVWMPAAIVAAIVAVYLPVFDHAFDVWRSDQELSFGFMVAPVAALLLALRWRQFAAARGLGHPAGLAGLALGLGLLLAGLRSNTHALAGLSFFPVTLGTLLYFLGGAAARVAALPAALVTGGLSLYRGLLASAGFFLQQLTAQAAAGTAGLLGVPVRRSGVDLFAGGYHFVVAQACSGMDSLLALLCLGALVVGVLRAPPFRRALLLLLVLPIILVANVLRITLLLLLAPALGPAAAQGLLHALMSASLFVAATLLFLAAGLALRCVPSFVVRPSSSA